MKTFADASLRGLLAVSVGFCLLLAGTIATADSVISVKGSTTIQPLAQRLATAFEQSYPGNRVEVSGGGSLVGIEALIDGQVDIATSSTFISDAALARAMQHGTYPVPFQIANDCILPIVHRSNSLDGISLSDLRRVYSGEINNWQQFGGPDRDIVVIGRDRESGTYDVWRQVVMGQVPTSDATQNALSNAEIVNAVTRNPDAIGYIGLSYLSASIKPLSVDGIMGSSRSLRDGSYPISRPLFLFTNGWPEGRVMQFVNFVLDPEAGQKIIAEQHYIPLR